MMIFLGFVVAVGLHYLGLLHEHHKIFDGIIRVVDKPGTPGPNFRRKVKQTTSTESGNVLVVAPVLDSSKDTKDTSSPRVATPAVLIDTSVKYELRDDKREKELDAEEARNEKERKDRERKDKGFVECTKNKRLNVALFYADDWTMKVLGILDKRVKTPNIDTMAKNGIVFTNNCVTTSVCWASRATLATGTYTAVHKHTMPFDNVEFETRVWSDTLYPLMKRGSNNGVCSDGYYTGLFGKWHKLEIEEELNAAFDERIIYYGNHWEERDGQRLHVTELNTIDSVNFLENWRERFESSEEKHPFFLTTSFFATHARDGEFPSYQPKNSTRLRIYPDIVDIPPPKTATKKHWNQLPHFLRHEGNEGRTRWKKRFEPTHFQSNIKDIYAMATEVDEAIGAIIDKIKSLGVYNETVMIFTTDNGNMHGEHGLAEKWYPFEESLRVPLVIQDPRMPEERKGTISDAWTLNIDLAPTILGIGNRPPSKFMQGRDISDLYLNNLNHQSTMSTDSTKVQVKWRKDWFYEFNLGQKDDAEDHPWRNYIDASFALITDEWKYVYWPQHKYEQLFHRSVDPFDEFDLLNKIFRPSKNETADNKNGCCDTVQTTMAVYKEIKERYRFLKERAQKGERI